MTRLNVTIASLFKVSLHTITLSKLVYATASLWNRRKDSHLEAGEKAVTVAVITSHTVAISMK